MKKSLGPSPLIYPTPVWCVGTYDPDGRANVATIAWGGICCSKPPAVTISLRKATYTYGNIMEKRCYTISVPSSENAREADYFGIASGKQADKFQASGLTPERSDRIDAPYVKEFPMVLECQVIHVFEIGLHTQFVGEILDVKVDERLIGDDGFPDMNRVDPFVFCPEQRKYYGIGALIGDAFKLGKELR